jgi:antitoxin component YwqK of YwqJK toxin-antitoxin module
MNHIKNDHIQSKTSLVSHPVLSHSKLSQGGITSKKQKKIEYTRDFKIKLWEEMEISYFREGIMALGEIKKQNETVVDSLN